MIHYHNYLHNPKNNAYNVDKIEQINEKFCILIEKVHKGLN